MWINFETLDLSFRSRSECEQFPTDRKKTSVVPLHGKENYHAHLLLPALDKIFETPIFKKIIDYFIENDLISPNQSILKKPRGPVSSISQSAFIFYSEEL